MTSQKQMKKILELIKEKYYLADVIFQHNGAVDGWYFVGWEGQIINQLLKQTEAGKTENSKT